MSKILLHTCCGPCTTYVNKWLNENGFEVKGLFYNPNIQPQDEYERRLLTMKEYANIVGLELEVGVRVPPTREGECKNCYRVRLRETANFAKDLGFEYFSTTLLISPYQKHELLKQVGEEVGQEFGIEFFYQDFRVGYRESREMSRAMKLYMQKYCGCKEDVYAKIN